MKGRTKKEEGERPSTDQMATYAYVRKLSLAA